MGTNSDATGARTAKTKETEDTQSTRGRTPSVTRACQPGKNVHLPPAPDRVRRLVSWLDSVPEVRQERVEVLRAVLTSGEYNSKDDDVAAAILAEAVRTSRRA